MNAGLATACQMLRTWVGAVVGERVGDPLGERLGVWSRQVRLAVRRPAPPASDTGLCSTDRLASVGRAVGVRLGERVGALVGSEVGGRLGA
jgi:hypothetical protein